MAIINEILHGDCLDHLSNKDFAPDDSIDLILTSPPYADQRAKSYGGVEPNKYVEWFLPISLQLKRVLKESGSFILNIKEHPENGERQTYVIELILALRNQGWYWIEEYCWYKKNSFPGKWPNRFRDSWERCLHFTKNKKFNMYQDEVMVPIGDWAERRFKSMTENDFIRYTSKNDSNLGRKVANWLDRKKVYPHNVLVFENEHYIEPTNVLEFATECSNKNHSAAFPIELPIWFIKLLTKEGDLVLDPFIGSGTTAVASVLLNRSYLGLEISREYQQEALKNIIEVRHIKRRK
ncbi:MAG TPA: site-specific DNA-methyltransferase [Prolixibacteraceae bacterium]|jgi:site-specific DNA-methyltransferase (adenine-specific)/site-specific DNA-methyltransferase (cytosine-N4-specific)